MKTALIHAAKESASLVLMVVIGLGIGHCWSGSLKSVSGSSCNRRTRGIGRSAA
ncbi:hypothetical protein SAMN04488540_10614 [Ferrimonas sediminum]|uniref:Uncharacterized protein n=1 Tax=Ferrimonas sediminum TaxID=718193 RepID=A0A1G8RXN8_9GAMM|nr:hypothetical protein [Ferrimonas sediminum]SDJ21729.1 hypothetical protein SAMN04488540_10614 [Ferrimonas sediminum]